MPRTENGSVRYDYIPGHFLCALAEAYKDQNNKVLLVIDELNRGNAASIFGPIFNLLDRDDEGKSSYPVKLSNLDFSKFIELADLYENMNTLSGTSKTYKNICEQLKLCDKSKNPTYNILLPKNFYIIATINTSDESIYYMDAAFKRRWEWIYIDKDGKKSQINGDPVNWVTFRNKLNDFILSKADKIRNVEDKLIGPWFVKLDDKQKNNMKEHIAGNNDIELKIERSKFVNKVMFHLWDSVFARDKSPLKELLGAVKISTYGDFLSNHDDFISKILPQPKT